MLVRAKGETLEAGACVLTPACEDGFVMTVVDGNGVFGENNVAVGVANFSDTNEGVSKGGHTVAGIVSVVWELGQVELMIPDE